MVFVVWGVGRLLHVSLRVAAESFDQLVLVVGSASWRRNPDGALWVPAFVTEGCLGVRCATGIPRLGQARFR